MAIKIIKINGIEQNPTTQQSAAENSDQEPERIRIVHKTQQAEEPENTSTENADHERYQQEIARLQEEISRRDEMISSLRNSIQDMGLTAESIQALDEQAGELREQLAERTREITRQQEERNQAEEMLKQLEQETETIHSQTEEAERNKQKKQQILAELEQTAGLDDEALQRTIEELHKRYQKLKLREETASSDIELDGEQLQKMRDTEFIDPAQLRELEDQMDEIKARMKMIHERIRSLCLEAQQKSKERTDQLFAETQE